MGSQFEASDILEIAMRIEENGSAFYRYAEQLAKSGEAKKMFEHLATEEDAHKAVFKGMLAKVETRIPPETYPGEYGAYLKDYADGSLIFTKEAMEKELGSIKDTLSAIDFAIRRELDSILYYHEIKGFISQDQHGAIEGIINEERKHFNMLSKVRKEYTK